MNKISAKYAEYVLLPKEEVSGIGAGQFRTADDKVCEATFISGWDNRDGRYDKQLDWVCRKYWGVGFSAVKSLWHERRWEIEGYWYLFNLRLSPAARGAA